MRFSRIQRQGIFVYASSIGVVQTAWVYRKLIWSSELLADEKHRYLNIQIRSCAVTDFVRSGYAICRIKSMTVEIVGRKRQDLWGFSSLRVLKKRLLQGTLQVSFVIEDMHGRVCLWKLLACPAPHTWTACEPFDFRGLLAWMKLNENWSHWHAKW